MIEEPLREMMRIFSRADELLSALYELELGVELSSPVFTPPLDLLFTEHHLYLVFEVPGVRKEDMRLWVAPQLVYLAGMRRRLPQFGSTSFYQMEIPYGRFERRVKLPYPVNPSSSQVKLEWGVLTLTLERWVPQTRVVPVE